MVVDEVIGAFGPTSNRCRSGSIWLMTDVITTISAPGPSALVAEGRIRAVRVTAFNSGTGSKFVARKHCVSTTTGTPTRPFIVYEVLMKKKVFISLVQLCRRCLLPGRKGDIGVLSK